MRFRFHAGILQVNLVSDFAWHQCFWANPFMICPVST